MPELHFTEKDVAKAEQGEKIQVLGTPRLYFIKNPERPIRYLYRYPRPGPTEINPQTGRPKSPSTEIHIGKPGITLNKAKEIAVQYAGWLRDGIDPQQAMKWKPRDEMTFGQLANQYIDDNRQQQQWGDRRVQEANLLLHEYGKKLTPLRIAQVTSEVVRDTMKSLLKDKPYHQVQRARELWKQVMDNAIALRLYPPGFNPADWKKTQKFLLRGYKAPPRKHLAAMPEEQVPAFLQDLRTHDGMGAIALECMFYTLLRPNKELLGARWTEFNWNEKIWTVPGSRMKNGEEFQVPLVDRVIILLKRLKERATTEFVFTGYKRYQPLAEKTMLLLMRGMGITKEVSTVHGLRSTFRDWAARQPGFDQIAAEICLSHTLKNPFILERLMPFDGKVMEAYNRDKLLDKRRIIMNEWAAFCG
jgi:integrase